MQRGLRVKDVWEWAGWREQTTIVRGPRKTLTRYFILAFYVGPPHREQRRHFHAHRQA
ncbi:protein of unknown function [Thauera humireducens]|nr:protein of unknown function [Thauera humireducens]